MYLCDLYKSVVFNVTELYFKLILLDIYFVTITKVTIATRKNMHISG